MLICPNFSDKNVLREFNELKELVGEVGAYHIWSEQNGNPIDQTKDGKPSKLFSDLLTYYNGDRAAAIRAKAKTFTETFKEWFEGSTAVDQNGEPIVTEFDGDRLFIADPKYNATKELMQLAPEQLKSVDNTGSFSKEDSRRVGSEFDETLQFYLSNSLDIANKEAVEEFIDAYRQFYEKYHYDTKEHLEEELDKIIDSIHKTLKARLYVLNKKDVNVTDEFKAALVLQMSELENKAIDRVTSIYNFIMNTKSDVVSTMRQIRAVAKGQANMMPLRQLLDLKQDFFDFYCPLIDDCINTLTAVPAYKQLIGEAEYNKLLTEGKKIQTLLNSGANSVDKWINEQSAEQIRRVGISVSSPTIENYIHEHKTTLDRDILTITAWVGAGDKINDEAVKALFHITQQAEFDVNRVTFERGNKLLTLLNKVGKSGQKKLVELDENGVPTGYMVRRRNYGKFNKDYKAFLADLKNRLGILEDQELRTVAPEIRAQYNKEKNKWLSEHCERKYTPEYYEMFNNLSPLAADARELVQIKIRKLLDTARDSNGVTDINKLSPENKVKLQDLYLEKKQLASIYDVHGNLKTGEEYDIAVELSNLNQKLSQGMVMKSNMELFKKVKAEKKATLSDAEYQRWLKDNSRDEYTQEFYDDLAKVERAEISNEKDRELYESLQERKRAILRQFRDDKTHEITKLIPAAAQYALDRIDNDLYKIRKRSGSKKISGLKFSDIAKVEPSQLFYELRADAIATNTLDIFEMQHCNKDLQGNIYPKSYLTKIVPTKEKYILREQPSIYFSEVAEESPFVNPEYKLEPEDEGEYYLPKLELYDNSKAFDAVRNDETLYELYKECVSVMAESNEKLTNLTNLSAYRLPQMSGSMWRYIRARGFAGIKEYWKDKVSMKNDDKGLGDTNVDDEIEGADKMHFVPQNYVKSLDDPGTITANTVGSIIEYFRMAENFRVKSELKPKTEAILQFIGSRDIKSKIRGKSKKGVDSNLYKFAKSFVEMNIYDIKTKPITSDIKERDISIFGFNMHINPRKVNITKMVLGLKTLGTLVNLGLNLVCAGTGAITTSYTHFVNAVTGRYYNMGDWLGGYKDMAVDLFKNNFGVFSDYSNSTQMKLMEYFQVGTEFKTDRTNQSLIQKQIARNWAFGIYSVPDYFCKGVMLNAVMRNFRFVNGEFLSREEFLKKYAKDEVMLNQWDTFRSSRDVVTYKNGTIQVKYKMYSKAWEAKQEIIGNTARNLAQSADGQLTPLQRTMLSSNILGSLVMMHRQFMPIILQERWIQNRQWDYSTGRYKEALFRVPFNIMGAMYRDSRNLSLKKKYMQNSTWEQRKAVKQLGVEIALLTLLHNFIAPMAKAWADDDKDNVIKQLIAFCLVRTDVETFMSTTPWAAEDAIKTIKTPFPVYSYYDNFSGLVSTIPQSIYGLITNDNKVIDRGAYEDYSKTFKYIMKLTPIKNLWELQDIPSKRRYYETQIAGRDVSND